MAKGTHKKKAAKSDDEFESVKIRVGVVNKVRANKQKTGVPVGTFFEQAAEEKLSKKSE